MVHLFLFSQISITILQEKIALIINLSIWIENYNLQVFGKEYINLLLTFYFFVLGIFALSHMMSPIILKLIPGALPVIPFHLRFDQGEGDAKESVLDYEFNTHDLVK